MIYMYMTFIMCFKEFFFLICRFEVLSTNFYQSVQILLLFETLISQKYAKVMAELEKRWEIEVEDHVIRMLESPTEKDTVGSGLSNTSNNSGSRELSGNEPEPPFFHDYHLQELRQKELALLAFLRDVPMDSEDMEATSKSLL